MQDLSDNFRASIPLTGAQAPELEGSSPEKTGEPLAPTLGFFCPPDERADACFFFKACLFLAASDGIVKPITGYQEFPKKDEEY